MMSIFHSSNAVLKSVINCVRSREKLVPKQNLFAFRVYDKFEFVTLVAWRSINANKMSVAMTRPINCMTMNIGTDSRAIPANDSLKLRAIDTPGLAKDVDEVNQ